MRGEVGKMESHAQRPRLFPSRRVAQIGQCGGLHCVVVLCVMAGAGPRLLHRHPRLICRWDAVVPRIYRCPAVDCHSERASPLRVHRDLLPKAVKVVQPNQVHLSRQHAVVAYRPQRVRPSRNVGRKRLLVVPTLAVGDVSSRQEGQTRRDAERRVAIRGVEGRAGCGQALHVGRPDKWVPVGARPHGPMLVGHDHEEVRLVRHRQVSAT